MTAPTKRNARRAPGASVETVEQSSPQNTADAPAPQARPRPWREVFSVHPAADLFPLMSADELRDLADDIKKNGLIHKATYNYGATKGEFVLLDGRNRLDALALLGEHIWIDSRGNPDPRYCSAASRVLLNLAEGIGGIRDVTAWVISENIKRRHLTGEQKRDIIAKLLKATPEKSNRSIGKTVNVDHKTVAAVRSESEGTGEIPQLTKTVGKDGKARPATKPKTVKLTITKEDRAPKVVTLTTTKVEPKPVDVLAEFKRFVRIHLDPLPVKERTEMAQRWIAHINTAYLPERGEPIVDVAKRVIQ